MQSFRWCIVLWLVGSCDFAAAQSPNIIFILSDDQGWNDISWHDKNVLTPHLQGLSDSGVRLEYNYVQPLCTPTRSALLTGYYPYHLGRQGRPIGTNVPTGLTVSKTLMPERLSELGYSTHAVGKWHLGFCDEAYTPTHRGFDTFYGLYQGAEDHFTHVVRDGYDMRDNERVAWEVNGTYSTYVFGDRAVEIIHDEAGKSGPFFLYLALQNVHTPLQVPDEYLEYYPDEPNPIRRPLLGMLTAMDDVVGRVVKALHSSGQANNTLIIFSSDNGGVQTGSNTPLRGSKGSLWEGGTRVPAMINGAMLENTPRVHNGIIHVSDWHNTLLAAAGAQALPENDGFNQWEALKSGLTPSPRDSFIYNLDDTEDGVVGAIRFGKYKFVMGPQSDTKEKGPWLFDLSEDESESVNLAETRPDIAADLEELLLAQLESLVPFDNPDSDPAGSPEHWGGVWSPGWCVAH